MYVGVVLCVATDCKVKFIYCSRVCFEKNERGTQVVDVCIRFEPMDTQLSLFPVLKCISLLFD
jgi:hypothetical protein